MKDKKARALGYLTLNALGVIVGSVVDAMRSMDVPNDVTHRFLDELEDGFSVCLYGQSQHVMLMIVATLRAQVPDND